MPTLSPDGNYYELQGNDWVKVPGLPDERPAGRMPGIAGVAMEGINAANYSALGVADFLTGGLLDIRDKAGEYGIGSQAGYMDPGIGRDIVQGAGQALPAAGMLQQVLGRNLASVGGAAAEFTGFGSTGTPLSNLADMVSPPITNLANKFEQQGSARSGRMANRIAETISGLPNPARAEQAAGEVDRRVMQGTLYPSEYAAIADELLPGANVRMTPGQQRLFSADRLEGKMQAMEMRRNEDIFARSPKGIELQRAYDYQRALPGLAIRKELQLPAHKEFTDEVLGEKMNELGLRFDRWADTVGTVQIGDDLLNEVDTIAQHYYGAGAGAVKSAAKNVRQAVAEGGGNLTGEQWQTLRKSITDVRTGANTSKQQGMSDALGDMQELLTDALEASAPQIERDLIADARRQWALIETVQKPGVRSKVDSSLNINSLYNQMFQGQRGKRLRRNRAGNDLARMLETFNNMGTPTLPSSGSGETILGNIGGAAKSAAKAGASAAGIPML